MCHAHCEGGLQVELLMSDSIISLRVLGKSHKYKSRFRVSKVPYKTQDREHNTES